MDAPGVKAFTGFFANYGSNKLSFDDGVTVTDVSLRNPPNAPSPVGDDEKYFSFGLTSEDGLPLAGCRRAVASLVSTNANTGCEVT